MVLTFDHKLTLKNIFRQLLNAERSFALQIQQWVNNFRRSLMGRMKDSLKIKITKRRTWTTGLKFVRKTTFREARCCLAPQRFRTNWRHFFVLCPSRMGPTRFTKRAWSFYFSKASAITADARLFELFGCYAVPDLGGALCDQIGALLSSHLL